MTEQYPEFLQAADQRRREDEGRAAVVDYLCSLGVDESVASGAWIAVQLAVAAMRRRSPSSMPRRPPRRAAKASRKSMTTKRRKTISKKSRGPPNVSLRQSKNPQIMLGIN
jgi:hypothetical protein